MKRELTDDFLREVIARRDEIGYQYAPKLAEVYGSPIGTIHRWINEARRRGLVGAWEHRCVCTCGRRFEESEAKAA